MENTRFFKFYSLGRHKEETLQGFLNNQIYVPSIDNLNDPFEGSWYGVDTSKPYNSSEREFKNRLIRRGVFCMCSAKEDSDPKFPYSSNSILMWSHYADSHKGFCVEFSDKILGSDDLEFPASEVEYSDVLPEKSSSFAYAKEDVGLKSVNYDIVRILLWKNKAWNYENEYRLCFKRANQYFDIPEDCIKAIYCGCKMSTLNIALLRGIATKLDCGFHILTPDSETFSFRERTNW